MEDKNIIIVRCGEIALKGMNKPYFERMLVERIRKHLDKKGIKNIEIIRNEGLIFLYADKSYDENMLLKEISKVFGVASISPALKTTKELDDIGKLATEYMLKRVEKDGVKTFKIKAKRADKNFPITSPEIGRIIGAKVLVGAKVLKVDVHNPDVTLYVDVRKDGTYIYEEKIKGFGGLPLGTNGKGMILLSGGIDSPVAAWMMAKRGMLIEATHYHSYPYTSERAKEKVEELASILASYCGKIKMNSINLLPIQEAIVENCPEEETTILVRRFMMRIAERMAEKNRCMMLITGENLGQVASQTAEGLVVTDEAVKMPVMRPLIGMDKVDIMDKAMEIGTYEKSIEPYEDCCTVFLPKHPVTKPKLSKIRESEGKLDIEKLVEDAIESVETVIIEP